ncbi:hypothetical protein NW762_008924 [Fusarium torreyae]|uniref:CBM1 domain-containing protein n=1 Tax=Fusarium torreyae TaxID=1237075 RepID=A0A9W8RYD7_9HYPO|nr:hypothetical protein NW762_008924 [Fusarium torreyae]
MFIVSHYDGSRFTVSNNEFDGVTTSSASCNNNHYWATMFIADGDKVTFDKNYLHDVSGRAPKLGADGVSSNVQATNNLFSNMKGHAFDAYKGVSAILEGNAFESVDTPITESGAGVATIFDAPSEKANDACESVFGRACEVNSLTDSGEWPEKGDVSALDGWTDLEEYIIEPVAASGVAAIVKAGAGPAGLGSAAASKEIEATPEKTVAGEADEATESPAAKTTAVEEPAAQTPAAEEPEAPTTEEPATEEPTSEEPIADDVEECNEEEPAEEEPTEKPTTEQPSSGEEVSQYGRCGGNGYTGSTKCAAGTSCVVQNPWYSQCLRSSARRAKRALRIVD